MQMQGSILLEHTKNNIACKQTADRIESQLNTALRMTQLVHCVIPQSTVNSGTAYDSYTDAGKNSFGLWSIILKSVRQ